MNIFSIRETVERESKKSKQPASAIALFELMAEISRTTNSAGWIVDNGENLWKIKQQFEGLVSTEVEELEKSNHAIGYGAGEIDVPTLARLRTLSAVSQCWWTWLNGDPVCVPLVEWDRALGLSNR